MRPRIAAGQEGLIAALNDQYRGPLLNFFRRRVRDLVDAEDLTQDTFVRMLALAEHETVEDPGALLFRIAGNLLKDRYRMGARRRGARVIDLEPVSISAVTREFIEEQDPERVFMGRQRVAAAIKALGELGERTQTIYILFRLENMPQAAIAELFGVSKSTVEKTIMKASVHLIKRLGPKRP